jgi:hypothetical protein
MLCELCVKKFLSRISLFGSGLSGLGLAGFGEYGDLGDWLLYLGLKIFLYCRCTAEVYQ